jgi:Zn-dependent protease
MSLDGGWLIDRLTMLGPLWLSLSFHEWAHAWSAHKLGDDTASLQGRLTLNPLAHIDPIGTFLLPLLGVPFGWAKPVPINPLRFRSHVTMRTGILLTAAAGPISNLVLAAFCTVLYVVAGLAGLARTEAGTSVFMLLHMMILTNIILAAFNALPVPPLDGSRVMDSLVPDRLRRPWEAFCSYGNFALLALIFLPNLLGFSLFGWIIPFVNTLLAVVLSVAG